MEEYGNSFSNFVKNEILEYKWENKQLKVLFYSFLRANGNYSGGGYIVKSSLKEWEHFFNKMFQEFFNISPKAIKTKKLIKYEIYDPEFLIKFTKRLGNLVAKTRDDHKAYISGLFIAKGWISNPKSTSFHFEVRVRNLYHSLDIQEIFEGVGIKTLTIQKNKWYFTYIKKSTDIANVLKLMNASQSVMFFEDQRINRDFISTLKKMDSIEYHNIKKSNETSKLQIKAIKAIKKNKKFLELNEKQKWLAELRVENPSSSFSSLMIKYEEKYKLELSKSTISNWLKIMVDLANQDTGGEKNK
ncbi:MAG: hypothetical protein TYPL_4830 [Candidatus Tyloplasma litorale]|nr:MAG: hypothetical protein TYPL_4830 [Mycoplasmatales bacterium]